MMQLRHLSAAPIQTFVILLAVLCCCQEITRAQTSRATSQPATSGEGAVSTVETIVILRHGEKPVNGLGQLSPKGLNRAIALSGVLPEKFGKPDALFAPDPHEEVGDRGGKYFYVRPLITIEPTAIRLGMPVQTPFGFSHIGELNKELTQPKYASSLVFVAWEHGYAQHMAVALMKQFKGDVALVPAWPDGDYDSLYVVKITRAPNQPAAVAFTHEQEGLDGQSKAMPEPAKK